MPLATTVVPLGSAGCAGIGGSEAPGGNDAALGADGLADVAADGGGVAAALVAVGVVDGGRVLVAVAARAAVVGRAAAVGVAGGVEVATMRSVSEHAAVMHRSAMAASRRSREIRVRILPA